MLSLLCSGALLDYKLFVLKTPGLKNLLIKMLMTILIMKNQQSMKAAPIAYVLGFVI